MKTSTSEGKHGIQCVTSNQLKDWYFARELPFLSHTHQKMQMKANSVAAASALLGLNIHKGKSKILKYNTENINAITVDGEALEDVETFYASEQYH
ncbi:unnamed protein product [Schistosoma curassoni]|uniref:Ovule protein n=1 Tax=Schistosoma curassoni TaxID=6186 RepID=A0A183JZ53_9TREM|nr:unnamed protein product [Schistosoma curassoni]